jgi:type III secretion system FlhB-like substrate exporter
VNEKEKRGMIIYFTDGTKKVLEFPQQLADGDASMAERIKELLKARNLTIEADGALVVIPLENVKYIQSYPAPKKLPAGVIRGASFKD